MNALRQYRILYRDFLFRIVDRELLSSHAKGDASQLLLQVLTLLLGVSVLLSLPALFINPGPHPQARLFFAWSVEHFLIATTMAAVGVFAVLGWGSLFPDQRDIQVLAPLPVHPRTILLAKLAAIATAVAGIVAALQVVPGLGWSLRLNAASPTYTIPALVPDRALPPVSARDLPAVLDRDFENAMRQRILAAGGGGVSIGVYSGGERRFLAYGAASTDSVFPIASVTKTFTGLALAHLIEEGQVRADQPVRELLRPAGVRTPRGEEITLADLVAHRSGLPPMPVESERDPSNPFADFDVDALYRYLGVRGVGRPAVTGYRYSNLGFGLLGHALERRAGVDYETLIRQRITGPLGMTDTGVVLAEDQRRRLLPGHNPDHRDVPAWSVGNALTGAGALMSTAPDMLRWLEANLHPERLPPGSLANAIRVSHERPPGPAATGRIAFGWMLAPDGDVIHAGDIAGYSAIVLFNPSKDRALAVLANTERGTAISADIVGEHVRARLDGTPPIALAEIRLPAQGGAGSWLRRVAATWVAVAAAALFVFGAAFGLQGAAAALLPHRLFLRLSPVLQLAFFAAVLASYFVQPLVVVPAAVLDAQGPLLSAPPSYWFLGLLQALRGSPALDTLAARAMAGLGVVTILGVGVCALTYRRTLLRLAEQPDVAPVVHGGRWLPLTGGSLHTAVAQFTTRTLFRSAPHRVIFTFYVGIGVALAALLLKAPRVRDVSDVALTDAMALLGWTDTAMEFIAASVLLMACAIVGARLTFAMPRDVQANWIFRALPGRSGAQYTAARRRALVVLAAGPVWAVSAAVLLVQWPWLPAAQHLTVLALVGAILVELSLWGSPGIPFTSAYLPGGSRAHVAVPVAAVLLVVTMILADKEAQVLQGESGYPAIVSALALAWIAARWRTASTATGVTAPAFDEAPADQAISLEL
jgi:CubicO group peptidase (beta-lactamase class C family)